MAPKKNFDIEIYISTPKEFSKYSLELKYNPQDSIFDLINITVILISYNLSEAFAKCNWQTPSLFKIMPEKKPQVEKILEILDFTIKKYFFCLVI